MAGLKSTMRSIGLRDGWRGIAGRGMGRGCRKKQVGGHKTSKKALQSKLKGGQQRGIKKRNVTEVISPISHEPYGV